MLHLTGRWDQHEVKKVLWSGYVGGYMNENYIDLDVYVNIKTRNRCVLLIYFRLCFEP